MHTGTSTLLCYIRHKWSKSPRKDLLDNWYTFFAPIYIFFFPMEQNYRLNFKSPSDPSRSRWRGGAATIEPHSGGVVWGVVWKLNETDKESLDRYIYIYTSFSFTIWLAGTTLFLSQSTCPYKTLQIKECFLFYLYVA